jgi:hypothetical protein
MAAGRMGGDRAGGEYRRAAVTPLLRQPESPSQRPGFFNRPVELALVNCSPHAAARPWRYERLTHQRPSLEAASSK